MHFQERNKSMNTDFAFVNGNIVSLDKAYLHIRDTGFLRGYGVFDVLPIFRGEPFFYDEHWGRLEKSADTLGLKIPLSKEKHYAIIKDLLQKNGNIQKGFSVRSLLTGGYSEGGFFPSEKESFCILLEKVPKLEEIVYTKGVQTETLEYKRDFASAKTTNYIKALHFRRKYPEKKNIFEIIYTYNGQMLEASTSNIFVVKNSILFTPKDDVFCGTTRSIVIQLAKENNFEIQEATISVQEMFDADEVFLTASNKALVPIITIDKKQIGGGTPGRVTTI
ncbi:MAG: hypothetical protein EOM19_05810, partial [Candidatus Moranbacteria bacterium]|nr:hypothetical protein [Candidatus Moranbacteria bacterium]